MRSNLLANAMDRRAHGSTQQDRERGEERRGAAAATPASAATAGGPTGAPKPGNISRADRAVDGESQNMAVEV